MDIMPLADIVEKWNRRVSIAGPEYEDGVRNPRRDWQAGALAANDNWKAGVQAAVQADRFAHGVRRSGTAKWQARTIELGLPRWPTGVAASGPQYSEGFEPYHRALAALTLPPRYARGDPRNYQRVQRIGEELRKVKLAQARAGA